MKALIVHGPGDLRYDSVDDPKIVERNDAVVRVRQCGICGSDLHIFHGQVPVARARFGIGHEAMGEVVEIGRDVQKLKVGDMVMLPGAVGCGACAPCRAGDIKLCQTRPMQIYGTGQDLEGCQAEAVRVPAADFNAIAIPEGISDDQAVLLTDNLPTAYGACRDAEIRPGRSVAVIGLGTIGLIAVELAILMGASVVYAIDLVPERCERAAGYGAVALDGADAAAVLREKTGNRMIDCVIDAAGGDPSMELALALVGVGGNISVLGVNGSMQFRIPIEVFINGVTIRGNFATEVGKYIPELIPLLQKGLIAPEKLITSRAALGDGLAAYAAFEKRAGGILKTMLRP